MAYRPVNLHDPVRENIRQQQYLNQMQQMAEQEQQAAAPAAPAQAPSGMPGFSHQLLGAAGSLLPMIPQIARLIPHPAAQVAASVAGMMALPAIGQAMAPGLMQKVDENPLATTAAIAVPVAGMMMRGRKAPVNTSPVAAQPISNITSKAIPSVNGTTSPVMAATAPVAQRPVVTLPTGQPLTPDELLSFRGAGSVGGVQNKVPSMATLPDGQPLSPAEMLAFRAGGPVHSAPAQQAPLLGMFGHTPTPPVIPMQPRPSDVAAYGGRPLPQSGFHADIGSAYPDMAMSMTRPSVVAGGSMSPAQLSRVALENRARDAMAQAAIADAAGSASIPSMLPAVASRPNRASMFITRKQAGAVKKK